MKITFPFPFFAFLFMFLTFSAIGNPQKPQRRQSINPVSVTSISRQANPLTRSPAHLFERLWKQVDSLAGAGLPKSALEIVNNIYAQAKAGKDDPQVIKAIIYRIRLNSEFQENFMTTTIAGLKKEISGSGQPQKQVLQSILAEVYWKYYQNNQYRFRNRTRTTSVLPDSIETWDLATISGTIIRTYLLSLGQADTLQRIPIGNYDAILEDDAYRTGMRDTISGHTAKFIPTLYDFLANRALDYFTSGERGETLPAERFEVDQAWFFAQPSAFANSRMMIAADPAAPASYALRIFRDLAAFHLKDQDPRALIESELKRLAFVHEKYILPGKDSLYPDALRQFEQAAIASPWSATISHALATFLNSQGQLYQPLVSDLHKWDIRSAMEVCDKTMQRFPGSEGSKNCKILSDMIKEPFLQVTAETAVPVDKPSLALVGIKNLQQVFFRLAKVDPETYSEKSFSMDQLGYFKSLWELPAAKSWEQKFPSDGDYQKHQAEIEVFGVPAGFYVLLCSQTKDISVSKPVFAFTSFWSTQITYVSKLNRDGSYGYYVLDRETGMPPKNARVEAWQKNYNSLDRKYEQKKLRDYTPDEQGFFLITSPVNDRGLTNQFLKIYVKDDYFTTDNFTQYRMFKRPEYNAIRTMFYTDRAIYRPGQIVYFKGIMLEVTGDRSEIKPNFATWAEFRDVNGQRIASVNLTTNEFGSFNGSFIAPTGVLPGQMTISNQFGSASISVEEYKRPTFDVSCDPLEGNYKLGETLTVTGKAAAFAGNAIDAAAVKYRVVRTARFPFWDWGWRWPMPASPEVEIANGTSITDAGGKFIISFRAIPDAGIDKKSWPVFDFSIYADVTDLNGETQSVEQHVSVGFKALLIGTNIPEMVNLAADTLVKVTTTNLNGRSTPAMVSISLQRLRQPGRAFKTRSWERPDLHVTTRDEFRSAFPNDAYDDENDPGSWTREEIVFEKTINTRNDSTLNLLNPELRIPTPGSYLLLLKSTDPFGEVVEVKKYLTVFSPVSKEVPVDAISWYVPLKTSCEPGEAARFLIGSREDNVNVIYEIRLDDSLVSRQYIKLNNRAMLFEIPVKEEYRGNFSVNFFFVKHNRVFQNSQLVNVPLTSKKLGIAFETFRSKLDPGSKERWKIKISTAKGKPADAEFLATMYDASLDQFRSNEWAFSLYEHYTGMTPWDVNNAFRTASGQWYSLMHDNVDFIIHPGLKLNWFGINYFDGSMQNIRFRGGAQYGRMGLVAMDSPVTASEQSPGSATPRLKQDVSAEKAVLPEPQPRPGKTQAEPVMQIRRDFRETAFFYPSLHTDSAGSLVLEFTAPESLTRWKFLGLAHTKALDNGLIGKELVTSKEMMVFPNTPRFVRQGDTLIFSTKIVNLSDRDLDGEVTLALTDAITLQSFNNLVDTIPGTGYGKRNQVFSVKKGQSTVASWRLFIPAGSAPAVLQYRMTAHSGNFSDGEEKAIPVLTNRMLVTESLPLPVRGKGTFDFSFDKLLQSGSTDQANITLKNHKLTLEFASNPAWYAIQALPALNDRQYDNADAIFAAFWANSAAGFIANSNPKIKTVFESWKNLTPDALQSNLAKNQELKSALLQETPWVMEAAGESGRKQKLGLFFDQDNLRANLQENLLKLQKLQAPNGGWTWFAGMPENRYITQNIVTGLGKLSHLGITNILHEPSTRDMVMKAIGYLDVEMQKDYENLKKYQAKNIEGNHLGSLQIQYLYARSFFMADPAFRIPDPGANFAEAFDFYKKQASRYWLQNDRYLQGMIALALNRLGSKEAPVQILKSLSEKAIHSNEMGMYWSGEQGYFWYQAPIETQALMVEAFDEIQQDKNTVDELKIWLLKQKQTQDWRSPRATIEACYALLLRGTDLLSDDPGVKISLGKEKVSSDKLTDVKKEAGTGYFQLSWSGTEINPDMGKISVSKSGDGVAWGAVYWQYFENLDKITPASTPMHLEKKLFVERNTASGPVLEPITNDELRITNGGKPGTPASPSARSLKTGDKIVVRIVLTVDRDLEFVHMKDMRASAFEPRTASAKQGGGSGEGLSGYRYQDGLGYYQGTTDQATNFFFDNLPKGTYVFEYALTVNAAGEYSNGITTIQCMYAPEFSAHSEGIRIRVK
ncbi:MAG: MG2 domain-containing protein [Bacteroidetes bacterium]|nr:MG2 domain-containing protein [Bacteroidota bacterium]